MNAQQLKNAILQEAIEGRLVPQDPNDEPASVLLEHIRKEKERLVKEKKIVLSKPEKAVKKSGEIPFVLPANWTWALVNDVCRVYGRIGFRGYTTNDLRDSKEGAAISLSPSNMINGVLDFSSCTYISDEKYEESPEIQIKNGDILIVKTGSSYGKTSIVKNLPWKSTINPQIAVVKEIKINKEYLKFFFQSSYAQSCFKSFVLGTSIPTFSQLNLISMYIPLPPLAEQHRIVAKIEELLPKVEEYGKAQDALNKLNAELPERLKKSILQEAIEGRLVPQDPNDEPASVLLDKIRQEKAQLVKAGKLKKKDLIETPITEDEIPFEIPASWEWVRIKSIFSMQAGKNVTSADINSKQNEVFKYPCYGGNGLRGYVKGYNTDGVYPLVGRQGALCGNVNIAKGKFWATEHAVVTDGYGMTSYKWQYYFLTAMNLNQYATATAQPGLAVSIIIEVPIPLPPLAEQHRIVEKLEQLFGKIDKLKK